MASANLIQKKNSDNKDEYFNEMWLFPFRYSRIIIRWITALGSTVNFQTIVIKVLLRECQRDIVNN